jgi:hypothetical protein
LVECGLVVVVVTERPTNNHLIVDKNSPTIFQQTIHSDLKFGSLNDS